MPAYALTIFLGAFLLFQLQPLIAKYILPWFGGGPGVWTSCMLFFQLVLLAGYAYAHALTRWIPARRQTLVHLIVLSAAVGVSRIIPSAFWKPDGNGNPTWQIVLLLLANIGLPYFVLSSTGPLLQQWFCQNYPTRSPYRLYALSNAGSLLALVSYPLLVENHLSRKSQAIEWQCGFIVYALCCAFCAFKLWKVAKSLVLKGKQRTEGSQPVTEAAPTPFYTRLLWLLWPACGSLLLLAVTNKICQDIAVVPFLWVLPLSLYLLSFIICFDNPRWYNRSLFTLLLVAAVAGLTGLLLDSFTVSMRVQITAWLAALFIFCMVCHGELFQLKPPTRQLTLYYLMISLGGALGGLFVALMAPVLFISFAEVYYGLLLCAILLTVTLTFDKKTATVTQWRILASLLTFSAIAALDFSLSQVKAHSTNGQAHILSQFRFGMWGLMLLLIGSWLVRGKHKVFQHWKLISQLWLWLGCMALALVFYVHGNSSNPDIIYKSRNFYGVLKVYEHDRDKPLNHHMLLQHGRITHGIQFADPQQAAWPTTYYSEQSGIGLAVASLTNSPRRIGVVGLGAGTMAAYARPGDDLKFYEIDRAVEDVAFHQFTYVPGCLARVELVSGDARLSLEKEPPQNFDLFVLDAFSSDAIPVHLLTREAFELYGRHLRINGIIAVHISNRYLDLQPVLLQIAHEFDYQYALIDTEEFEDEWWQYSSAWVLLTHDEKRFQARDICSAMTPREKFSKTKVPLWTDDFTSLFQVLK